MTLYHTTRAAALGAYEILIRRRYCCTGVRKDTDLGLGFYARYFEQFSHRLSATYMYLQWQSLHSLAPENKYSKICILSSKILASLHVVSGIIPIISVAIVEHPHSLRRKKFQYSRTPSDSLVFYFLACSCKINSASEGMGGIVICGAFFSCWIASRG
jgi:hypothetical protein